MRISLVVSSVVVSLCAACGGSSDTGSSASCATTVSVGETTSVSCQEWTGLSSDEFITVRTICNAAADASAGSADAGTLFRSTNEFRAGPCDRTGALGGCNMGATGLGASTTSWSYTGSIHTRESVQQSCDMIGGTFVAP